MKVTFSCPALLLVVLLLMAQQSIAQWVHLYSTGVNSFVVLDSNLFAGSLGVLRSTDEGNTWTEVGRWYTHVSCLTVFGKDVFAGTTNDGIFRGKEDGTEWTSTSAGLTYPGVTCLAVSDTSIFAGTYAALFRSTDQGAHWVVVDDSDYVYSVYVSGTDIFAGTEKGLLLSHDNGNHWTLESNGLPNAPIACILVCGTNLFAAPREKGVFLSTDYGTSWTPVNDGLTHPNVKSFAVTGHNLFVGTWGGGVYLSTNDGTNWAAVNDGLMDMNVLSLDTLSGSLYAGTYGGLWMRELSDMPTSVDREIGAPIKFGLEQNYPNPFNPATVIRYRLPHRAFALLKVYDVLGREVQTMADQDEAAGSHSVVFDGSRLPGGVYFYRLQAGPYHDMKTLMLLK